MQLLPICYYVRARHYLDAGKLRESLADWDAFLAAAPPTMRGEGRLRRGDVLARLGEYRRALADVRPLVEQSTLTGPARYDLACVYALCAAAVARDAGLPLPQRERDAEAHARQAVALLRRAAATGYFGAAAQRDHMDRDPDLDGLRSRADFRAFVAGLPRE